MRLKVGDLARITRSTWRPELIGQVCEIVGPYEERLCISPTGTEHLLWRYLVRLPSGEIGGVSFRNLEPLDDKQPDQVESEDFVTV